ncbi:FecR family protein [Pedobacter aquatilis]|uniref:FecR family protein n=1 Tax=Pedobacter aquatilis TaxID=351343 RepID=UPI0029319FAE|nr:FecR domain-containing protein [Pedobacter aquatilis]
MIDRSQFDAEDFLVDSTFQQFCAGTDKLCVEYWEKYISAHPEQAKVIAESKRLYFILSGNKRPLNNQLELLKQNFDTEKKNFKLNRNYNWLKIAAAIFLVASIGFLYENYKTKKDILVASVAQTFSTKSGERKKITLSDGSTVLLNAKSSISISATFNETNREVILNGEAYFDVVHNKDKPFKVHTNEFNINVLGTAFNVRAYSDEISSEATLIRGLITMEAVNGNGGTITLKPSQKVTFYKNVIVEENKKVLKPAKISPEITINHYTLIKDSTIVETAWTQNRIEIYDQDFDEIQGVLEKWFNVKIKFADPEIEKYRFTATFSQESIEQVLSALQKVENFKYEIKGNQVIISK